jgi:hypothetical protein
MLPLFRDNSSWEWAPRWTRLRRKGTYTTRETTVLLYGVGPVEFKYVNPSDDPRAVTSKHGRQ